MVAGGGDLVGCLMSLTYVHVCVVTKTEGRTSRNTAATTSPQLRRSDRVWVLLHVPESSTPRVYVTLAELDWGSQDSAGLRDLSKDRTPFLRRFFIHVRRDQTPVNCDGRLASNRRRSKEDQVSSISQSIFVTNFPDSFSSRDLWKSCDQYGKVSDVFIPTARSKAGKRVIWVDVEGVPSLAWTPLTFQKIAQRWGELLYAEDPNDNNLYRKRLYIKTKLTGIIMETFKVIVRGKEESEDDEYERFSEETKGVEMDENATPNQDTDKENPIIAQPETHATCNSSVTPPCPPGFTPNQSLNQRPVLEPAQQPPSAAMSADEPEMVCETPVVDIPNAPNQPAPQPNEPVQTTAENITKTTRQLDEEDESVGGSRHVEEAAILINSQSFLQKLDDFVLLGQTMGYDMAGCQKNVEAIINYHGRQNIEPTQSESSPPRSQRPARPDSPGLVPVPSTRPGHAPIHPRTLNATDAK
ncbi:hypothetical protein LXL04_036864 [Taraxacum kok-saghyz]